MIFKKDDYTISEDRQSITISQNALYRNLTEYYKEMRKCLEYDNKEDEVNECLAKADVLLEIINLFDE